MSVPRPAIFVAIFFRNLLQLASRTGSSARSASYRDAMVAYLDRAWASALTLIVIVMVLNLLARIIAKVFAPKTNGR